MTTNDDMGLRDGLDRLAIQDLIYRYSDAVTRGDYEQMASVFASDATWESPLLGMHFENPSEFVDMQVQGNDRLDVLIQTASNPVIEFTGEDRARATTTVHERIRGTAGDTASALGGPGSELNIDQDGVYYDELAKVDGAWKFTRRLFAPLLIAQGTVTGDVVAHRPLPAPDSA